MIAPTADDVDRDARFPRGAIDALQAPSSSAATCPVEFGGLGLNVVQVGQICEALGHYCGSTAMIFAMHQIQVACIVHHARRVRPSSATTCASWSSEQRLIASATTELGRRRRPAVEHLRRSRSRGDRSA